MLVSEQSAIAQSESAYSSLISGLSDSGKLSKDKKLIARVQKITDRLITQAVKYRPETKDWKWSVKVIDDPETVNAFCMAGGKMAVFTGLISKVEPTDDELAQVMGHEISHALASHSAEKMSVQLATGLAVAAVTAAADQKNRNATYGVSSLAALALITLPNSREAESEADRIGIELAARAGYKPHAAVTLWEKMMKASGQTSSFDFLSTHPASTKRIEALSKLESSMSEIYAAGKTNQNLPSEVWTGEMSLTSSDGAKAETNSDKPWGQPSSSQSLQSASSKRVSKASAVLTEAVVKHEIQRRLDAFFEDYFQKHPEQERPESFVYKFTPFQIRKFAVTAPNNGKVVHGYAVDTTVTAAARTANGALSKPTKVLPEDDQVIYFFKNAAGAWEFALMARSAIEK